MKYFLILTVGLFLFFHQGIGSADTYFKDNNSAFINQFTKDTTTTDSLKSYEKLNNEERIKDTLMQILGISNSDDKNRTLETIPKDDTIHFTQDTIQLAQPSELEKKAIPVNDSLGFTGNDTIYQVDTTAVRDTILFRDTIFIRDTLILKDTVSHIDTVFVDDSVITKEMTYEEYMNHLEDSLVFDKPDSSYYVIRNIQKLLTNDLYEGNDTIRQAIDKLFRYKHSYKNIDSVKSFLQLKDKQQEFYFLSEDTTAYLFNDSIKNAIRYILNSIPEDSSKLIFKNSVEDSIQFKTAKEQIDSIHFKIYDNRGEYALLWIKKTDEQEYDLILEDGTYIEKAKQQKIIAREVDTDKIRSHLKKVRKVDIIVPIWDIGSTADITFNQGYQSNWVEGGENNLSALSILRFNAEYTYGKQRIWDTDIEYKLGYLKAGDNPLQKNDDRFELNSKYGRTAFNNWYYSLLFNFKTQFLKGYDYPNDSVPVSKFLSPGHLVFSLGLDYKPNKNLTVLISPITSKFTIVSDTANYDQTRFGVGADEKIRKEIGAYVKAIWKYNITKDIFMENKINFFTNYTNNPQNIDVDWELNIKMKLTRYINMSLNTQIIYDDDVDIPVFEGGEQVGVTKGVQFREVIGVGFSYNF
ncbi:MAG TPA: DUF3078 domain-containing protein [Bacteroidales bacterium]|nr:DUF3078 domain-containing protein [Bacteroidales bacterium]